MQLGSEPYWVLRSVGCFVTTVVGCISPTFNRRATKKIRPISSPELSVTKQLTLRFLNRALCYAYVIRSSKMHTFYINILI